MREETNRFQIQDLEMRNLALLEQFQNVSLVNQQSAGTVQAVQDQFAQLENLYSQSQTARAKLERELDEGNQEREILSLRLEVEQNDHAKTQTQLDNCWKATGTISTLLSEMWTHLKDDDGPTPNIAKILLENEQQRCKIAELQASTAQVNSKRSPDQAKLDVQRGRPLRPAKRRSDPAPICSRKD